MVAWSIVLENSLADINQNGVLQFRHHNRSRRRQKLKFNGLTQQWYYSKILILLNNKSYSVLNYSILQNLVRDDTKIIRESNIVYSLSCYYSLCLCLSPLNLLFQILFLQLFHYVIQITQNFNSLTCSECTQATRYCLFLHPVSKAKRRNHCWF